MNTHGDLKVMYSFKIDVKMLLMTNMPAFTWLSGRIGANPSLHLIIFKCDLTL